MSIEGSKIAKPMALGSQGGSLKWKITASFSGLILLLGVLVIAIVYYFTSNALQKQVDLRSVAIATNLSDASAGYVSRKSSLELDALIAKYGRLHSRPQGRNPRHQPPALSNGAKRFKWSRQTAIRKLPSNGAARQDRLRDSGSPARRATGYRSRRRLG